MRIGRRPLFFVGLVVVNLALIPATPVEYRWVNVSMAALALFWAVALGLEEILTTRPRGHRRDDHH